MGRLEGPGCYCFLNSIFRRQLDLMVGNYDFVVMDNEAGMSTSPAALLRGRPDDHHVRPYRAGSGDGPGIRDLAREMSLELKKIALVISRVQDGIPEAVWPAGPRRATLK